MGFSQFNSLTNVVKCIIVSQNGSAQTMRFLILNANTWEVAQEPQWRLAKYSFKTLSICDFLFSRHHARTKGTVQLSTGSTKATMSASLGPVLSLLFLLRIHITSGRRTFKLLQQPQPLKPHFPRPQLHLQSKVHILTLLKSSQMGFSQFNSLTRIG